MNIWAWMEQVFPWLPEAAAEAERKERKGRKK